MRFCLVSTHTDQTIGYSKIATNLLRQLAKRSEKEKDKKNKVKLFHFGFQRHSSRSSLRKVPDGVVSYDAAANEDPKEDGFGYNKFKEYLDMVEPDVILIYNDILTISKFLDAMMGSKDYANPPTQYDVKAKPNIKIWLYLDVMYKGMHPMLVKKVFQVTDRIYVFSETAKRSMKVYEDVGLYGIIPQVSVLEHAVDETMYYPIKKTKYITREKLGIPEDGIVFLNCNRNSQRKRLDHSIMAFANLLVSPQTQSLPLYFVFATGGISGKPNSQGYYDVGRIYMEEMKNLGFTDEKWKKRLILIDTNVNVINDEGINDLYNLCDIGVNTSNGEGFGLCTFEHMVASGAAQIVTDTGCYSQYLSDSQSEALALVIPKKSRGYFDVAQTAFGFEYPVFYLEDIVSSFEECVLNIDKWKRNSSKIVQKLKSWEQVTEGLWDDILHERET
jgi:glycosyltransferase involved in cell wall biosynthesis